MRATVLVLMYPSAAAVWVMSHKSGSTCKGGANCGRAVAAGGSAGDLSSMAVWPLALKVLLSMRLAGRKGYLHLGGPIPNCLSFPGARSTQQDAEGFFLLRQFVEAHLDLLGR
jgi:hypothetical protein